MRIGSRALDVLGKCSTTETLDSLELSLLEF